MGVESCVTVNVLMFFSEVGNTTEDMRCVSAYFVAEFVAQQGQPKSKRGKHTKSFLQPKRGNKIWKPRNTQSSPSGSCSSTFLRGLCAAEQKRHLENQMETQPVKMELAKQEGEGATG